MQASRFCGFSSVFPVVFIMSQYFVCKEAVIHVFCLKFRRKDILGNNYFRELFPILSNTAFLFNEKSRKFWNVFS